MPIIYLSPSTQEWNMYVTGSGSEEYNMNLLADALVPYLLSNGIRYKRNSPSMTAASSIREANTGWYDLYLALHSNAAPEGRYGGSGASSPFIIPAAPRAARRRSSLRRSCGRSTPCLTRSPPGPPPPWERCACPGSRRCWWRSAITTITRTPPGWRDIWTPLPSSWPGR